VAEEAFHKKIIVGQAVLAVGGGILLFLLGGAILRADAEKHRFQYSLRRFMAMMFAASLCVLGGVHWWHSQDARAGYIAAMSRYADANPSEKPAHEVTVQKPFYLGKYVVTQEQYQQVTGANPSQFKGANLPVEMVSWDDAKEFCKKASSVQQSSGLLQPQSGGLRHTIRLPTEAEWEYACRAGTITAYYSGDRETDLRRVAWYQANSGNSTHPVGQKEPNAWGLYDMHGNVWEWCEDWWGLYSIGVATSPKGAETYPGRAFRGGCWHDDPWFCRAAYRFPYPPPRTYDRGFRLVVAGLR
jgi:formylglycine-generating enzyme required for sulfatase activity